VKKVAIAFSSKDRVELTKQTIAPLLKGPFDLHWFDGSATKQGQTFFKAFDKAVTTMKARETLTGGSCRYIVYALTTLLARGYEYIGLVENDCLLDDDWFEPTMALFETEGLNVGAVSARCYEDRILIQRDGYAVMHNLGAGMIVLRCDAAALILQQYRTGMTSENRKVFGLLSGIDIAAFWAFRGSDHMLVADWTWDRMLAQRGMCSLASTPAKATQLEDIAAIGLTMAERWVDERRDDKAFARYRSDFKWAIPGQPYDLLVHNGQHVFFAHQLPMIGGVYSGDWRFKWSLGYGCFAWKSAGTASLQVPVFGPCELVVSGGEAGGKLHVKDELGFEAMPELYPEGEQGQVLRMAIPGTVHYRTLEVTALDSGVTIYGLITREPQPIYPGVKFDFNSLPPL
jgi:hypothetical protein